jgi:hypothetical protein
MTAIITDIGRTPGDNVFFLIQDTDGQPRAFIGTEDMIEELARDLLDYLGREYCLPYICDHLEDRRS